MPSPISAIWRDTSAPLSLTPASADDSARTSAWASFGCRSIARDARCSTSTIWSAAVAPLGGDWATRARSRSVHSVMAAASRWSLEEK